MSTPNTEISQNSSEQIDNNVAAPSKIIRKFEIAVYDEDVQEDGSTKYNQVAFRQPVIIEAATPKELQNKLALYKQCGQIAKIVREIDPPSKEQIRNSIETNRTTIAAQPSQQIAQPQSTVVARPPIKASQPIKYYKVGDLEIKDDNGKLYQKQWMRLSDSEASNIRLINDKNNALVNINGKHFEMKKWILIENNPTDDEVEALEENLNE